MVTEKVKTMKVKHKWVFDNVLCDLYIVTTFLCSSHDFHTVFSTALDRGFAKLVDYLAEFYQPLQKTETSVIQ
jgi:hypothetical protein